jgi:hypothetical protein
MWPTSLSALAGAWLFLTPFLWTHHPIKAVLGVGLGLLAMILSAGAAFAPRLRLGIALSGVAIALSSFIVPDAFITLAHDVAAGVLLIIAGLAPRPELAPTHEQTAIAPARARAKVAPSAAALLPQAPGAAAAQTGIAAHAR